MAPTPGDNKIYKNWVSIGIFKGFTFFIIYQYLGDINGKDGIKGN